MSRPRLPGVLVGTGVGEDQVLGGRQDGVEEKLAVFAAGVAFAGDRTPREHVVEKARDLIMPVLGAKKFRRLTDTVFALEKLATVRELRPLIQKG